MRQQFPIAFHATRPGNYLTNVTINGYGTIDVNIGAGFDGETGVFTAPVSGAYWISFLGLSHDTSSGESLGMHNHEAFIRRNGVNQVQLISHYNIPDGHIATTLSGSILMPLDAGDEVDVFNARDVLSGGISAHFSGSLLYPFL